jgi:hypothetical protein
VTDWSSLQTADGSAESVPTWIAQLSAASLPERDEAFLRLFGQLVGEGLTHDAAPAALDVLAPLARARAEHLHRSLWLAGDVFAAGHLARIRGVDVVASAARREVLDRGPAWRELAEEAARQGDDAWRAAAAFALAFVPGGDGSLVLAIARHDPSVPVRVCATFACGWLARTDEAMARALEETPDDAAVADATRVARAIAAPERASEATEALVRWLLTPSSQELTPWGGLGRSTRFADAVVRSASNPAALAPALARALRDTPPGSMRAKRSALLEWIVRLSGLEGVDERTVLPPSELPPAALAVAKELAVPGDLPPVGFGLPGNAYAIRRWLGLEPAGLLEEPPGDPRWRQAYRVIARGEPFEAVKDLLFGGCSAIDRLRFASELLRGAYGILANAHGRIDIRELEAWADEAGEEARPWALDLLGLASEAGDLDDFAKLAHVTREHLTLAIVVVHRHGGPIDPAWIDFVLLRNQALARRALEAFDPSLRRELVPRRFARCGDDVPRGMLIKDVVPLWDLLGSPELLAIFRAALEQPRIARELGKKVKTELEKLLG